MPTMYTGIRVFTCISLQSSHFTSVSLHFASFLQSQSSGHHPLGDSTVSPGTFLYWLDELWNAEKKQPCSDPQYPEIIPPHYIHVLDATETLTPYPQQQHLNKLRHSPADLMALALAFLLPSGSALAFSIGWQMERAWIAAGDIGTFCSYFRSSSNHSCSTTFNVQSGLLPADSLEKTPRACVLSIHLIFIPPSLKIDRTALNGFCSYLKCVRSSQFT